MKCTQNPCLKLRFQETPLKSVFLLFSLGIYDRRHWFIFIIFNFLKILYFKLTCGQKLFPLRENSSLPLNETNFLIHIFSFLRQLYAFWHRIPSDTPKKSMGSIWSQVQYLMSTPSRKCTKYAYKLTSCHVAWQLDRLWCPRDNGQSKI